MMHRVFFVIGLGLLAISPTLADVVNVTVNSSLSGSGSVITYCLENLFSPECSAFDSGQKENFPFSFSATNTQLGFFVASGGVVTGPPENSRASVEADASEKTTATADALEISLSQDLEAGGIAIDPGVGLNESVAVSFNLTEESKIQLTDNLLTSNFENEAPPSHSVELLDSNGNVILVIQCEDFPCSTVSTVLQPGAYQLDDSLLGSAFAGLGGFSVFFDADLNASFTPVVPEPRWTIIATLLAAVLGGCVMSRRENAKRGGS
jgi:hypothetical protein